MKVLAKLFVSQLSFSTLESQEASWSEIRKQDITTFSSTAYSTVLANCNHVSDHHSDSECLLVQFNIQLFFKVVTPLLSYLG